MINIYTKLLFSGAKNGATQTFSIISGKAMHAAAAALLLVLLLSTSGCTGVTSAPKTSSNEPASPSEAAISVAPASINFGSVPLGSTASQSVTVSNKGDANLTITKTSAITGVTITGVTLPLVIEAGKQSTFNVVYAPKTAGALSGQVSILSSISTTPSTVTVRGIGMASTAVLTSSTSKLSFGSVTVGKNSVLSVIYTNAGNSNVTISKVTLAGADYIVSGVSAGMILAPGQSATLDSTFAPRAAGTYAGSVTVVSTATDSPSTITLSGSSAAVSAAQEPATSHSVSLAWTPSTSVVAGYNVYRSEVSGGPYAKLDSSVLAADAFTDSAVSAGRTYYYVVTADTAAGVESADSTQVSVTVPMP